MHEVWKAVDGHPFYEVSNLGRVRAIQRMVSIGNGAKRLTIGRNLKPIKINQTGYVQVHLDGGRQALIHRLVAHAFCHGYFDGAQVNHKNGVRDDNRAENLEWVSALANIRHAYGVLGRNGSCLGKWSSAHPTSKPVIRISKTGEVIRYGSAMDAVREGFRSDSISRCCNGLIRSHAGFTWRFDQ